MFKNNHILICSDYQFWFNVYSKHQRISCFSNDFFYTKFFSQQYAKSFVFWTRCQIWIHIHKQTNIEIEKMKNNSCKKNNANRWIEFLYDHFIIHVDVESKIDIRKRSQIEFKICNCHRKFCRKFWCVRRRFHFDRNFFFHEYDNKIDCFDIICFEICVFRNFCKQNAKIMT